MEAAVFKAIIQDGGGYDNLAGVTLANGEILDFVGPTKYRCSEKDVVTLGGEMVLKKRMKQRSKKTGEYDLEGHNYVTVGDIQSVVMVKDGADKIDPRSYRF